jgi:hypothetical protein
MLLSLFSGLTLDFYSIRIGNVERQFRSSGCKSREVDVVLYDPVPSAPPGVPPPGVYLSGSFAARLLLLHSPREFVL